MCPTFVDSFSQTVAVDAADTALLVIDMQNATGNRDMGLGKILAEQGTLDDAAYRFNRIDQVLIPNISKLANAFRSVGSERPVKRSVYWRLPISTNPPLTSFA